MAVFSSTDELYRVMGALFQRLRDSPEIAARLVEGNLVLRFRWREPDGEATVDLRRQPIHFELGPCELSPDVEMTQRADVAHRFWLGRLNVPQAIATRQVVSRGSVPKALKLLPAVRPAFDLYPQVLRELGLGDLVPGEAAARRAPRWWQRLVPRRRGGRMPTASELEALNAHLIPLGEPSREGPLRATAREPIAAVAPRELLRRMMLIRAFEEHLSSAYAEGALPTEAIHLSIGQEATAVGACAALRVDDTIVTTHRGHGHMLAKGADLDGMLAEIYGRRSGLCGGKGGSMHVTDARVGALGANGIVGASPLIASGAALAARMAGSDEVSVAFLGDGATNQGMFHEALNFAAVFDLPAVFVVENNRYGEFTPLERHTRVPRLADRAAAYGVPGVRVDGNDVLAVEKAVSEAAERARAGLGPTLVECLTYRWHGHMEGETVTYREQAEVEEWRARDPVDLFSRQLVEQESVAAEEVETLRGEVATRLQEAVTIALHADEPDLDQLSVDVFSSDRPELYQGDEPAGGGREISCSAALREALVEEMNADPTVFLLGEDVSQGGYFAVTAGLGDEFPGRVLDTPISEYAIVGAAVGAAMRGMRPVAEILFSDFLTTCMDPLVNQAAKLRYMSGGQYAMPLVVRTPGGAGLGMAAQHSQSLEALLTGIPGLIVVAPATPADAKGLLKAAIRSSNPVLFFENKLGYLQTGLVPEGDFVVPIGRAAVRREGCELTVVSVGAMLTTALAAAESLSADGIEAEVIDVRTLVPLDAATIVGSVARTGRLVTVEEGALTHGFGAEIVARVTGALPPSRLKARPRRVAGLDVPIPYARALERAVVPDEARIVEAVRAAMAE